MQTLTLTRPDDWHIHLRDGDKLADTVRDVARYFGRAICMPNLVPPVKTTAEALGYYERIRAVRPAGSSFEPLMVLYLTDQTDPAEIAAAKASGKVVAAKLYPAGATTNSHAGVTAIEKIYPVIEQMAAHGMPLLVHGEVTHDSIDIFDREKVFIDTILSPLVQRFPALRVVLEHITTADAVAFVESAGPNVAATITAHHLMFNRNHMLVGGIRPHLFCLPILKRNVHQEALQRAAVSGNPRFFLGTDSAPHAISAKEAACGCAGSYTAHAALELYAEVFEQLGALDKLEGFASFHGPDFYRLPRNRDTVTLLKESWEVPEALPFGPTSVVPIRAGATISWKVRA
ncbi:dihydroorotase [Fluviicoccus keumensis]|uniref:dihydroorotase n=1 Tax=Fluviicoccus keumensis TaxID=1435465 RepID=UPI00102CE39C|nr:dihydroorotase [Fluviicoccus keumensis]